MLSPSNVNRKGYADRPLTPLGEETGITSTPVSRQASPPPAQALNPYHYQPAIYSSLPELGAQRRESSNYARALKVAQMSEPNQNAYQSMPSNEEAKKLINVPRAQRSYSFSAEDLQIGRVPSDGG